MIVNGTKGDKYHKEIIEKIINKGSLDINPRPHWEDGTPAHTLSINHVTCTYDLSKGESPLLTLRPTAYKNAIKEILWIYQDASNDLDLLKDKYGITWWDSWDIGNRTIGQVYGATVARHELMSNLLKGIKENPDGRRHIISLWQEDDFKEPHGLKPCAFQTIWNVRNTDDGTYLDMCLIQRSSDFITAGAINQFQYSVLLALVAKHLGFKAGKFTWFCANVQIYDRHIDVAKELLNRKPLFIESACTDINITTNKSFYEYTIDDIKVDYPLSYIKQNNPQIKLEIAI